MIQSLGQGHTGELAPKGQPWGWEGPVCRYQAVSYIFGALSLPGGKEKDGVRTNTAWRAVSLQKGGWRGGSELPAPGQVMNWLL